MDSSYGILKAYLFATRKLFLDVLCKYLFIKYLHAIYTDKNERMRPIL